MLRKMISMARTAEETQNADMPSPARSLYDYGLTLRFNDETLDKLDLDTSDVEVGDMLHAQCMLQVTSVSKNDTGDGEKCCVEVTVTHIGIENEATEYENDE